MNENNVEIRSGTAEDVDAYVELFNTSAEYHAELETRFQYASNLLELTRNYYTQQCESEKSWTGLALIQDETVGYISAAIRERGPIHSTRTIGYIEGLFVKPEVRGKGIGQQLWIRALDWMKEKILVSLIFQFP